MAPTSDEDKQERWDPAFLEAMMVLQQHPHFQSLVEGVIAERERYRFNLAKGIGLTGQHDAPVVDQRELDYKRGFWNGAVWALKVFPRERAKDWDKFTARALKEAEKA